MKEQLRIVVIDDDNVTLGTLKETLKLQGYQVSTASDSTTALVMLEELLEECKPHLVILNTVGSDFDGFEILLFIRQRWDVPVIMLSEDFDTVTLVKALTAGADDYLVRPFGKLELAARLRAKLRRAYKGCLN
jgi:DNA-binding response OmpR family regulator